MLVKERIATRKNNEACLNAFTYVSPSLTSSSPRPLMAKARDESDLPFIFCLFIGFTRGDVSPTLLSPFCFVEACSLSSARYRVHCCHSTHILLYSLNKMYKYYVCMYWRALFPPSPPCNHAFHTIPERRLRQLPIVRSPRLPHRLPTNSYMVSLLATMAADRLKTNIVLASKISSLSSLLYLLRSFSSFSPPIDAFLLPSKYII